MFKHWRRGAHQNFRGFNFHCKQGSVAAGRPASVQCRVPPLIYSFVIIRLLRELTQTFNNSSTYNVRLDLCVYGSQQSDLRHTHTHTQGSTPWERDVLHQRRAQCGANVSLRTGIQPERRRFNRTGGGRRELHGRQRGLWELRREWRDAEQLQKDGNTSGGRRSAFSISVFPS